MSWLTRKRLDVPEVHALLRAQNRMLDGWAEAAPGSAERAALWNGLHQAGEALSSATYGGAALRTRIAYRVRPFDSLADRRRWFWQKPARCWRAS